MCDCMAVLKLANEATLRYCPYPTRNLYYPVRPLRWMVWMVTRQEVVSVGHEPTHVGHEPDPLHRYHDAHMATYTGVRTWLPSQFKPTQPPHIASTIPVSHSSTSGTNMPRASRSLVVIECLDRSSKVYLHADKMQQSL